MVVTDRKFGSGSVVRPNQKRTNRKIFFGFLNIQTKLSSHSGSQWDEKELHQNIDWNFWNRIFITYFNLIKTISFRDYWIERTLGFEQ